MTNAQSTSAKALAGRHTPGPWQLGYKYGENHDGVKLAIHANTKDGNGWNSIAECNAQTSYGFDGGANARLIAASPTMYNYVASKADSGDTEAQAIVKQIKGE